ncbi:MAG TPA: patatin-like phospholipase family protein [Bacteroidia bacterium]|jgi:patatin-like phospholipase/acyl hydrolase|nr:patatin-like phospholipase family protein [Bacteroidia bacterium]
MSRPFRILSIDGGGIRGILPGQIMVTLEKKLQTLSNNPQARVADYFDMIAGTSTGGILTCLYLYPDEKNPTRPLFTTEEAVNLYLENGGGIFKESHIREDGLRQEKYPVVAIEELLKKYFKNTRLSELLKPCLITSYNIYARSTHFFTQHDAKENKAHDFYLYDVARGTSAAPTYFEPAGVTSLTGIMYPVVDGGVFASNPALCAYAEARQKFKSKNSERMDMFMLSIGTGSKKESYAYNKTKGWGKMGWVKPVLDIMLSGASETVDFQMKHIFDAINCGDNYYRINPDIGKASIEMDDASPENLKALKEAGTATAEKYNAELEEIAAFLIKSHSIK